MIKRTIMALGLGVTLTGGAATAVHASSATAAHPAVAHTAAAHHTARQAARVVVATDGDQTGDADADAPCATDAGGNQTGNCQDSQHSSGPADTAGAADQSGPADQGGPADQSDAPEPGQTSTSGN